MEVFKLYSFSSMTPVLVLVHVHSPLLTLGTTMSSGKEGQLGLIGFCTCRQGVQGSQK